MTEIAIYDMDRTITRRATWTPFLIFAARRIDPWRLLLLPAVLAVSVAYLLRMIDRGRLKEVNQHLLLGHMLHPDQLAPIGEEFAERTLRDNVHAQAFALIEADRKSGRRLVLATASFAYYVVPLARRLGFDDALATGSMRGEGGVVYARIDGENCYAEGKLRLLHRWMEQENLSRDSFTARFYSDSPSDMPAFEWADERIAVNPTAKLRRIAEKRGWPIYAWG
ncbi:MAG: HAD-IB family hydrolase [Sphingomonadaceae bacterium]|nr:HAD-IB family hydrolase [Sphingomonadaceae bacterium]